MAESRVVTDPAGVPHISISDEFKSESEEFLATVGIDQWEEGDYGLQWHFAVKPVDMALQGATGMFGKWIKPSERKNSTMGALRVAMMQHPDFKGQEIGFGKLLGITAWFVRRDITFGEKDGKEMVAQGVPIPVREADASEKTRAASGGGPAPAIAAPEYDSDDLDQLLAAYAGKTPAEAKKAMARDPELSRELKNAIMSDAALEYLIQQGLVRKNAEGQIVQAEAVPA